MSRSESWYPFMRLWFSLKNRIMIEAWQCCLWPALVTSLHNKTWTTREPQRRLYWARSHLREKIPAEPTGPTQRKISSNSLSSRTKSRHRASIAFRGGPKIRSNLPSEGPAPALWRLVLSLQVTVTQRKMVCHHIHCHTRSHLTFTFRFEGRSWGIWRRWWRRRRWGGRFSPGSRPSSYRQPSLSQQSIFNLTQSPSD